MHFLVTSISGRPGDEIYPRKDPGRSGQERSTLVRPFGRACAATRGDLRVCNATDERRGSPAVKKSRSAILLRETSRRYPWLVLAGGGFLTFWPPSGAEAERLEDRRALRHRCAATEEQAAVSRLFL